MRDVLGILARLDALAGEDCGDVVVVIATILVEGHDRERVVSLSPLDVRIPVSL